jgi:hypothetical protein
MSWIGLVAAGDHDGGRLDRLQLVERLERPGPRDRLHRVGHRLRVLVLGQPLAHHLQDGTAPSRFHRRLAVRLQEPLDPAAAQPVGQRVPARQGGRVAGARGVEGRRDDRQRHHAPRALQREPQRGVCAHRGAGQHGPVDVRLVHDRHQVVHQVAIVVVARPPGRR